jgi:hypothetical protein
MTFDFRHRFVASLLATLLLAACSGGERSASADSDDPDVRRYARVVDDHAPGLLTWVRAERACEPQCDSAGRLETRYSQLLEMAREFQVALVVVQPPPETLGDLVGRTERELRVLRDAARTFTECLRESDADCSEEQDDAENAWREVPDLFEAWEPYR